MELDTAIPLRSRSSKSPDLVHLGYSLHVAAARGDKRRVKRCLKAGIPQCSYKRYRSVIIVRKLTYRYNKCHKLPRLGLIFAWMGWG